MLFKLSLRNLKKSIKDYSVYFFTLVLGIAIFYIFNTLESSSAILALNASKRQIVELLNEMMGYLSIFVSIVLGFLIIYANNFIVKRRKKEFGVYMLLGMGKRDISSILLIETIMVGVISLFVGLVVGVVGSQFMSVFTARLFEADMTGFVIHFDMDAMLSTIFYFMIIYVLVMLFTMVSISKTKLIDLINASRKSEKLKLKNPIVCVILFVIAGIILGYAYYMVTVRVDFEGLSFPDLGVAILLGCVGTVLLFYSFSGFILKVAQSSKRFYLRSLNLFVVRQMNASINTTLISMSIISILLFMSICILSSGLSINYATTKQLKEYTPANIQLYYYEGERLDDFVPYDENESTILSLLKKEGIDIEDVFKDTFSYPVYQSDELLVDNVSPLLATHSYSSYNEDIVLESDYNKIAKWFDKREIKLDDNEYAIIADFDMAVDYRNQDLKQKRAIHLKGKDYAPAYEECIDGFMDINYMPMNTGFIVLPDVVAKDLEMQKEGMIANYQDRYLMDALEVDDQVVNAFMEALSKQNEGYGGWSTKETIYEGSVGTSAIAVFVGVYLSITFLLTSAAILALKQLSDSSDNRHRYEVLRKIGADEKMIRHALLAQIGIFFLLPIMVAILHSIFGIQFCYKLLLVLGKADLLLSILLTAIFIVCIYGGYFILTYFCCKNIIRNA